MDPLIKKLRIVSIIEETPSAKTFVLEALDGWGPQYVAGQFLTLVFVTPFGEKRRSYSITSSFELNEPLSITVKRMANGEFSRQLTDHAKTGDVLLTSGIGGFFLLPEEKEEIGQLFFLAAGSGITPCYAMMRTALATSQKKITLIYSNRSVSDTIFYHQLVALQEKYHDRFKCHFVHSDSADILRARLGNFLLSELIHETLAVPVQQAMFYLCGPYNYMQAATITLLVNGVPAGNIRKEDFDTTLRKIHPVPPDINAHTVKVHLAGHEYQLEVQYPHTVTQAAKAAGIRLPYSCEAGRCGSCIAQCTSGKMWMAYNEVLTDAEVAAGRVLTCQAYAIGGDAEIQF